MDRFPSIIVCITACSLFVLTSFFCANSMPNYVVKRYTLQSWMPIPLYATEQQFGQSKK